MKKFLEVLNNNEKTKGMLAKFNAAARAKGLEGAEYEEARKTFVMMLIAMNKELVHQLADEIWEEVNA